MIKKISTVALATLICLPTLALAGAGNSNDRVADLEKQMTDMSKAFTAQMQVMKDEITALKTKNAEMGKEVASTSDAVKKGVDMAEWTKKVSLGGQVTFRGYNLQNVWDFNNNVDSDNADLFRTKGSIWADFKATDDVTARIKFTDQTWGEGVSDSLDNKSNKVFLDNANINVKSMFGLPVEGTFGRQDVIYGSGFVILDGQSQYASTSIYFDGVKLRWNLTDQLMLDGLYLKSKEKTMYNNANGNSGDDQTLSGFYLTNKKCPITGMQQEIYALNRNDEAIKKNIWMYGLRLSDKLANGIDYSLEGAIQRGDAGMANGTGAVLKQDAWGTKLNAGYTFKNLDWQPRPYLGYAFMSGNKSSTTDKSEQWDVFYGGWPQWGDLLAWKYLNLGTANKLSNVYSYNAFGTDTAEAAYSNIQIVTIGIGAKPLDKLSIDLSYSKLTFDQTNPGVSDDFGDYYQTNIKYQYTKNLSFSIYGALLAPGDAFNSTPKNNATEAYWEAEYKF
ncbi:MAG: alginate export family protein [Deltaproteobacteria bacterium]|nr:alginate export family protein [Deltaproteobacteria bacterium]